MDWNIWMKLVSGQELSTKEKEAELALLVKMLINCELFFV